MASRGVTYASDRPDDEDVSRRVMRSVECIERPKIDIEVKGCDQRDYIRRSAIPPCRLEHVQSKISTHLSLTEVLKTVRIGFLPIAAFKGGVVSAI
jgi:hypothetical protein